MKYPDGTDICESINLTDLQKLGYTYMDLNQGKISEKTAMKLIARLHGVRNSGKIEYWLWLSRTKLGNHIGLLELKINIDSGLITVIDFHIIPRNERNKIPQLLHVKYRTKKYDIIGCDVGIGTEMIKNIEKILQYGIILYTFAGSWYQDMYPEVENRLNKEDGINYVLDKAYKNEYGLPDGDLSKGLIDYKEQWDNYSEITTESGSKNYRGEGDQPDSAITCMIQSSDWARRTILSGDTQSSIRFAPSIYDGFPRQTDEEREWQNTLRNARQNPNDWGTINF